MRVAVQIKIKIIEILNNISEVSIIEKKIGCGKHFTKFALHGQMRKPEKQLIRKVKE